MPILTIKSGENWATKFVFEHEENILSSTLIRNKNLKKKKEEDCFFSHCISILSKGKVVLNVKMYKNNRYLFFYRVTVGSVWNSCLPRLISFTNMYIVY